jgi:serine/threonine-protein kinase
MINRSRWQQLSALLDEALNLPGAQRGPWLAALRHRDAELAAQLEPMLDQADADAVDSTRMALPGLRRFDTQLEQALAPGAGATVEAGQRLGPWELLRKIGEGGMGQIWLARRADGLYEAQAAIKLLRSDLNAAGLAQRFARERAALARLEHPAVARLLDAGVERGLAYLVLEYVDGWSLAEHVRANCPAVLQRVKLLMQIGEAVDHAHAQLIIHRDLKPSNVMIGRDGRPKLLDFGIAGLLDDDEPVDGDLTRQTGRGLTLGYAAPEQILGAPVGTAADVFSLGVMLFELLSGDLPFAPHGSPRLAMEHALLHDDPRRLSDLPRAPGGRGAQSHRSVDALDSPAGGARRPVDAGRVGADLEAIVAKALRKEPGERYGSVRALLDDLQRWLEHRPVMARQDEWQHRLRLWLRRNRVFAVGLTAVVASLSVGLATASWQWRRARDAAHQSDQVTHYLTELLASASPDRHGGQWPTVLQLLESSRASLPEKFRDDPETRLRLLEVLSQTYHELNRFDIAVPMFEETVALSARVYGSDDARALQARVRQARTFQVMGQFDRAIAILEPLREPHARAFGPQSEDHRLLLYVLSTSMVRAGRLAEAEPMLTEAGRLTDALYPPGSVARLSHLNHVQVLRVGQGRLREALEAMRQIEPHLDNARRDSPRQWLVFRRNTIAVMLRAGVYDRIEERAQVVLDDADRVLGPGNDLAAGLRNELARYFTEVGNLPRALAQREQNLARARSAGVRNPSVLLPLQVHAALARAQAWAASPEALAAEARELLRQVNAEAKALGYARAEAWINLSRIGLLLDDAELATQAAAPLRADAGLRLDRDQLLASRVAQIEGELARLRGDMPSSIARVRERMTVFERAGDKQVMPAWVAALDLACSLVLAGDAQAARALEDAAARRPPGIPGGHPLDHVQAHLRARWAGDSAAAQQALDRLARAQGREGALRRRPLRGSFGGAFI